MKHFYASFLLFFACNYFAQAPVISPVMGPSAVCSTPANPTDFSVTATNSPFSYGWAVTPSSGVVIGTPGPITAISFPNTNSTYTINCVALNSSGSSTTASLVVTVMEMPTVSFSGNNVFCQGSSTNLMASSTIIFSASSSLSYTWSPSTGLDNANSYSVVANPTVSTTYSVDVALGACVNTYQVNLTVVQAPLVSASASPATICAGSSNSVSTISINGNASQYLLNFLPTANIVTVSPGTSTTYTVSGTSSGCTTFAMATVSVSSCVGLNELGGMPAFEKINIYPNPNNGTFILRSSRDERADIHNEIGQLVRQINLSAGAETEIRELPPGVYFIRGAASAQKLIVTH